MQGSKKQGAESENGKGAGSTREAAEGARGGSSGGGLAAPARSW